MMQTPRQGFGRVERVKRLRCCGVAGRGCDNQALVIIAKVCQCWSIASMPHDCARYGHRSAGSWAGWLDGRWRTGSECRAVFKRLRDFDLKVWAGI